MHYQKNPYPIYKEFWAGVWKNKDHPNVKIDFLPGSLYLQNDYMEEIYDYFSPSGDFMEFEHFYSQQRYYSYAACVEFF